MKNHVKVQKYLVMLLLTIFTTLATAQFTRQQAIDKVLNEIVVADAGNINVYAAYTLKDFQDSIVLAFDKTLLCPYSYNWVFFVDDHPIAGWTHPCHYIFMDSVTGIYQITNEVQYPVCFDNIDCSEYEVISQIYSYPVVTLPPNQDIPDKTTTTNENLFAVLIVTQDSYQYPGNMHNRVWYDVSAVYNTLIQEYGYLDENIYVHYYNGTSPRSPEDLNEYNGENHFNYTASKSRILETFNNLSGNSSSDPNIPILGNSDQLFIFVDGHGSENNGKSRINCVYPETEYLCDNELAEAVKEIDCAQMIFLFETCHSGNFAVELTDYSGNEACKNRIVHTATTLELSAWSEKYLTNNRYNEFIFYWTAAVRGFYPVYITPWIRSFATGDFPFDSIYPYDHPEDYDPDLNSDGFIQMEEAFWYADDWDAWSEGHPDNPEPDGYFYADPDYPDCIEEPVKENTISCDNLTTLYGLAGTVNDYKELIGNRNYLVGNTLTVNDDLDFDDNANITISGENARIDVNNGGELYIYDDVTFSGGVIAVDGEIEIGQRATFNNMGLYLNNHNLQTTFNNTTFNQSMLHNYGMSLTIDNSLFNDCFIVYSHRGDVTAVNNSTFHKTWLALENQEEDEDYVATVDNCTFFNDNNSMVGVDILNYDKFYIRNNIIEGYYNGIQIVNSGEGASGTHVIFNNEIKNCAVSGIHSYNSTASISSNYLHNNSFGVRFFNYSNTALFGNSNATTYSDAQQIRDNYNYEVYASGNSFPWYMRHNVIIDEDNMGNPYDPLVYYDVRESEGSESVVDIRYNCWGNNFDQDEDLYPIDGFMVDPTWCPGGGIIIPGAAETLYLSGIAQFDSSEYINAKSTFEMVVNQYPETKYASAAMKDLFTIEKLITDDYSTLKQYYDTDPVIQTDTALYNLSNFLANKCDVKLENWQLAINHYEDIIINSGIPEDSIFAIIDLGYLYFLMDNSGGRAPVAGHLLVHKPNSKEEFSEKRDFLLSLLPLKKEDVIDKYKFDQSEGNILLQNTPNPTNNVTTIYFQLNEQREGYINVISSIGEIVREIHFSKAAGLHNIELDMSSLPVGIYYYSMVINGKRTNTKKMVVVK